ncbi:MAG: Nif3-like dinuclear metal center hexameric protein [Candidatus Odinarchaeum yellowstonii]|uniref:Nif3-like dinuclear metal center hexameric protein n=1 Tax=Odinarchaeota yellowstonii (strain LCB_4) TaxID=1841599 RepID=A0AAF0ICZ9_ODILC|nr:MAG: Nif3-like dinuclear metal center hexameric protein [Candidatus Odinarchaeum yellowstonii]
MVSLSEFIEFLERVAPPQLALPDDSIGLQIGDSRRSEWDKKNLRCVVVALEPSIQAVQYAVDVKAQLIITHHPLFYKNLKDLTGGLLQKVRALLSNYISLYVVHTNWDFAENGVNDTLIDLMGLVKTGVNSIEWKPSGKYLTRFCTPPSGLMSLKFLLEVLSLKLKPQQLIYVGDLDGEVKNIIVSCGDGADTLLLKAACNMGVDTYITGEASYHSMIYAKENNLKLVVAGHYETENPGMKRLSQILQIEFPELKILFFDVQPAFYAY